MFMKTTLQATVHLGQEYDQNSRPVENHFWSSLKKLFKETEKMIKDQTEINGVTTIDCKEYTWSATSLLCDRIHQISNAPHTDSRIHERTKVRSRAVQRQDHLHVNVQRHCMERKRNEEKCKSNACEVANYARRFPRGDWSF